MPTVLRDAAIAGAAWIALAVIVATGHHLLHKRRDRRGRDLYATRTNTTPEGTAVTDTTEQNANSINPDWEPHPALVQTIADRVTAQYGKHARLNEIGLLALDDGIPEVAEYDDGQVEELFEEVRDELAARDNGRRR